MIPLKIRAEKTRMNNALAKYGPESPQVKKHLSEIQRLQKQLAENKKKK